MGFPAAQGPGAWRPVGHFGPCVQGSVEEVAQGGGHKAQEAHEGKAGGGERPKYKAAMSTSSVPPVWTDALRPASDNGGAPRAERPPEQPPSVGLLPGEAFVASRAYPLGSPALELNSLLRKLTVEGYGMGCLGGTEDPMHVKLSSSPAAYAKSRQIRVRRDPSTQPSSGHGNGNGVEFLDERPFRLQRRQAMEEEFAAWQQKTKAAENSNQQRGDEDWA